MHFSHTLNSQNLYFKFDAELITYANCTFVTGAVHVIVRTQKRCCPLVLSEVSHEHSTTADSRSESGSATVQYVVTAPLHCAVQYVPAAPLYRYTALSHILISVLYVLLSDDDSRLPLYFAAISSMLLSPMP